MHLKPTKKQMQHGDFWSALASIGIPLAMNLLPKLFGNGLQLIDQNLVDLCQYMYQQ